MVPTRMMIHENILRKIWIADISRTGTGFGNLTIMYNNEFRQEEVHKIYFTPEMNIERRLLRIVQEVT